MRNLTLILLLFASLSASAQKLPNKQEKSVWAPATIKIDGRATEWENKFQAYNRATSLYYTISNNNDNLYLVLYTNDPDALTKITITGINFIVNPMGKKEDKNAISITYPIYDKNGAPYINFKGKPKIDPHIPATVSAADSFMMASNMKLDKKIKYIQLIGAPGLDTLISVYNEQGIKARAAFDNTMACTIELIVPLQYLGLSIKKNSRFAYHFTMAGIRNIASAFGITNSVEHLPGGKIQVNVHTPNDLGDAVPSKTHFEALSSTTDFWGEYTLAKAP